MRVIAFSSCMLMLCGCLTQSPAPVLLKGEEFFGKKNQSEVSEYSLVKDNTVATPYSRVPRRRSTIIVDDIPENDVRGTVRTSHGCDFSMPVDGKVVLTQGSNAPEELFCGDGITIVTKSQTSVTAASGGKILYVGKDLKLYGNLVILEHDKYTISMYYRLGTTSAKIGDTVTKGAALATVSPVKASQSNGDHFFCFAIRHNGKPVDPVQYLEKCQSDR